MKDVIIRGEFLIKDLTDAINTQGSLYPNIVDAWQDLNRQRSNDIGDVEIVYNFNNPDDLIECINMGMDAEDIAYLVNQFRDNDNNTQFFNYVNNGASYGLHILEKQDVKNQISNMVNDIASTILRFPHHSPYKELYHELICMSQIKGQK